MRRRGFSLVELVVSVSVLTVLVALFANIFSMISGTWSSGRAQAGNFNQARVALEVLSRDLQGAIVRADLPAFFQNDSPALAFYTKEKSLKDDGELGNRPLSAVLYAVEIANGESALRRKSRGFDYANDIGYSSPAWNVPSAPANLDSGIGPGVLVMQYQFIGSDGRNYLPSAVNQGWSQSGLVPGVENLRAVIVSIVVIDPEGVKLLQSPGTLDRLRQNFSTADPGPLKSFSSAWQAQMDDPAQPLAMGGVPRKALQTLRTFERTTLLPVLRREIP